MGMHAIENPLVSTGGTTSEFEAYAAFSVPSVNRYAPVNAAFRALLSGNIAETARRLQEVRAGLQSPDVGSNETASEFEERVTMSSSMVVFMETMLDGGVDGSIYTSSVGEMYARTKF